MFHVELVPVVCVTELIFKLIQCVLASEHFDYIVSFGSQDSSVFVLFKQSRISLLLHSKG